MLVNKLIIQNNSVASHYHQDCWTRCSEQLKQHKSMSTLPTQHLNLTARRLVKILLEFSPNIGARCLVLIPPTCRLQTSTVYSLHLSSPQILTRYSTQYSTIIWDLWLPMTLYLTQWHRNMKQYSDQNCS